MQRTPEPEELMDEVEQARAYAEADFSAANNLFIELLEQLAQGPLSGRLLDLGCGPADIPLTLAQRNPELRWPMPEHASGSYMNIYRVRVCRDDTISSSSPIACCTIWSTLAHCGTP